MCFIYKFVIVSLKNRIRRSYFSFKLDEYYCLILTIINNNNDINIILSLLRVNQYLKSWIWKKKIMSVSFFYFYFLFLFF